MSNLLKQCFVVNSGEGMRIINSNDRLKENCVHAQSVENIEPQDSQNPDDNEFAEGIEVTKLDVEAIRRDVLAEANKEADRILSDAKAQADQLLREADEKVKILFEEQKQLGYNEGARVKEEELDQKAAEAEEDFKTRKRELSDTYEQKLSTMESDVVDAVIQVFEKVFQIQFADKREILLALVANTLADVNPGNKIKIRVNPEDQAMLEEHLEELHEQIGHDVSIEFMRDKKFVDGQCQIETSYGVFDCGIDTQLSNLVKDIRSLV